MTNNELKYYEQLKQKKYRDSENKFLIEGIHVIQECISSRYYKNNLEKIFLRKDFLNDDLMNEIPSGTEIISLEEKKFNRLSETVNSQGIIGAVRKLFHHNEKLPSQSDVSLVVGLDNINDPGNLGTILRTCYWFGVDKIHISKNSVELFNSKVIRSSQGALFHLDVQSEADLEKELLTYYKNGFMIILAHVNKGIPPDQMQRGNVKKSVVVFGNEANGISDKILQNDQYVKVKLDPFSGCESLSVSVAAGIFLNEIRKKL